MRIGQARAAIDAIREPAPEILSRITDADLEAKMDGRHLGFKGKLNVYIDAALGAGQAEGEG